MKKNKSLQPRRSLRQKVILVLFGLFLFCVLLEVGLRLGGFILLSLQEYRNQLSIGQRGAYRIMCLGESTTAGLEDSYPAQLEKFLNKRNIGIKFSVINKGVSVTNTSRILAELENNLDKYKPNMVTAMMGINDSGIKYYKDIYDANNIVFRKCRAYKLFRIIWMRIADRARRNKVNYSKKEKGFCESQDSSSNVGLKKYYTGQVDSCRSEESFKKAIELNPKDDEIYFRLGVLYIDQGKYIKSVELFKKAIELNPKNDQAYVGLGWLHRYWKEYAEAEYLLKKAIKINAKNHKAYIELGWIYIKQEKFTQAEESFKKAIKLNPKDEKMYFGLGWFYRDIGKHAKAEELFKKIIEINPRRYDVYVELGWVYIIRRKFAEAETSFKEAIEIKPENDVAYSGLAVLYEEMGKHNLSKEYFKKATNVRSEYYINTTYYNYQKLKEILDKRGIKLVCVQYPMRSIGPLKEMFEGQEDVIFIDNEMIFREAVKKDGYREYFMDIFGGNFGHFTSRGHRFLAEHIAGIILKEYFKVD